MFSTQERLKRKTPAGGINRRAYLCLLVDEYYETSNLGKNPTASHNLLSFPTIMFFSPLFQKRNSKWLPI